MQISKCFWNGCDTCSLNPNLIDSYKSVCSKMEYSDKIKNIGNQFINDNLERQFISIHLRYPDYYRGNIKDINKLYDENDIKKLIDELTKEKDMPVFIATNNQKAILNSDLKICKMLEVDKDNDELESFIEQYICSVSKHLYILVEFMQTRSYSSRSTWSSFVIDYRSCVLNKNINDNIYLTNYFLKKDNHYGYFI